MVQIEQIFPSLTWRIRQLAMYPEQDLLSMRLEQDFDGIHFGLYLNHELSGVVSLFITKKEAQFRKMAILPQLQQQGLGSQLLSYVIAFCRIQQIDTLWCNARISAEAFYQKLGFISEGASYRKGEIDYVKMVLKISNDQAINNTTV